MKLLGQKREETLLLLVSGVYGLQLYATEYWTEYLLTVMDWDRGLDKQSKLYGLLCRLSVGLDAAFENDRQEFRGDELPEDGRLDCLREYPAIHKCVRAAISARSLKQLEQRLKVESCQLSLSPAIYVSY